MKKILLLLLTSFSLTAWAQLPYNYVKISSSPTNGKFRAVEIVGYNLRMDLNTMIVLTKRHFYSADPTINFNSELTGTDYQPYEHNLIANDDSNHQCNPANGLTVTRIALNDSVTVWKDPLNNTVDNPVGLFTFFKPLLSTNVALLTLLKQNVAAEDQIYGTWNK